MQANVRAHLAYLIEFEMGGVSQFLKPWQHT